MKFISVILVVFIWTGFCFSQNLVPNGNFSRHNKCPESTSQADITPPWFVPAKHTGTPDYFNICSNEKGSQDAFYQPKKILSDSAFIGLIAYYSNSEVREYFTAPLLQKLEKGKKYQVGLKVCLSNKFKYAANHFGAFLSGEELSTSSDSKALTKYKPQLDNPDGKQLANNSGWTLITGTFVASGEEEFITIGSFFDDEHTKVTVADSASSNGWAYYFVDDVFVVPFESYVPEIPSENVVEISSCNKEATKQRSEVNRQKKQ
ncbi:MAG: hypothetical protein IAF38_02525 [Bacteroidia bacterium]|nr:hypothetical protein [Bacteroidia bacterium]